MLECNPALVLFCVPFPAYRGFRQKPIRTNAPHSRAAQPTIQIQASCVLPCRFIPDRSTPPLSEGRTRSAALPGSPVGFVVCSVACCADELVDSLDLSVGAAGISNTGIPVSSPPVGMSDTASSSGLLPVLLESFFDRSAVPRPPSGPPMLPIVPIADSERAETSTRVLSP